MKRRLQPTQLRNRSHAFQRDHGRGRGNTQNHTEAKGTINLKANAIIAIYLDITP